METLSQTSYELKQLMSDEQLGSGLHMGEEIKAGGVGIAIGEVPFNPSLHRAEHINPLSTMELLEGGMGRPYVSLMLPFRPIEMNVVIHHDESEGENRQLPNFLKPIHDQQAALGLAIKEAIDDAAGPGDTANLFVVGDTAPFSDYEGMNLIKTTSTSTAAREAADIAARGLTFVISTYENLPLSRFREVPEGTPTIAVKANHKLHLAIPAGVGDYLGDGGEVVDTNNPKRLAKKNNDIMLRHAALEKRIGRAGLEVASIVYDPAFASGFDFRAADKSLAKAISKAADR